jgi:hypothetical protein
MDGETVGIVIGTGPMPGALPTLTKFNREEAGMRARSTTTAAKAKFHWRALAVALASTFGANAAHAFDINTGNDDITMRWDNTLRYNVGVRTQSQNQSILSNPNYDDGDRNFSNGSLVTNRLDDLSEFDFVYMKKYGFRVSAALWYDAAYSNLDNQSTATANTLVNGLPVAGALSPYSKRYSKGFSGEWLDAFLFGNFDAGDIPINVKAGQHTVFWGDSLLLGGAIHSVSYAQNSLDLQKGLETPGAEAKELFRPKGGLTAQAQVTNDLSIAGQWFYNWQAVRIPESGSYLTIQDGLNFGGDSLIIGPNPFAGAVPGSPTLLRAWNSQAVAPSRYSGSIGDFGLSARWSPAWLDGTLGFYLRNATDILPQIMLTPGLASGVPAGTCTAIGGQPLPGNACIINKNATTLSDLQQFGKYGTYATAYGNNIHIAGITLAKSFEGVSVGAELSYRQNMPLQSNIITVLPAPLVATTPGAIATTAVPTNGTPGALGDTMHGILNGIYTMPKTPLFDTATIQGELTWMQYLNVTQNEAVFKGNAAYTGIDKVSRNYVGLAVNFTPTWFQVFPGVDLTAPLTWSQGVSGNAAVQLGGNKDAGNWSAGVAADIYQKYKVQLSYNAYFGKYSTLASGAMNVPNGTYASLSDRGWLSLTLKTTF